MTELQFDVGKKFTPLAMHFDRFDVDDPTRCFFVESGTPFDFTAEEASERPMTDIDADIAKRRARLRLWAGLEVYLGGDDAARREIGRIDRTKHTIRVKKVVNDTELPGLRLDYDNQAVSFRWLDMFDRLFREQQALENMSANSLAEVGQHDDSCCRTTS